MLDRDYPFVTRVFYTADSDDACALWDAREVDVDGQSLWIDLSQFDRQSVTLNSPYLSTPYRSEDSSVYFLTIDEDIGPNQRVWWGVDGEVTELTMPVVHQESGAAETLVIDAY